VSKEKLFFRRLIVAVYGLNFLFTLSLSVTSIILGESIFDLTSVMFFVCLFPGLGAYGINAMIDFSEKEGFIFLLFCVQILLAGLILYLQIYSLFVFGFIGYAERVIFLAPSILAPWVFYTVVGLAFSFALLTIFLFFERVILFKNRLVANRKSKGTI